MKKVLLRSFRVEDFPDQEKFATIYKEKEIEIYLNQKDPEARELFIFAHGSQHFSDDYQFPQLTIELEKSEFMHNILSRINQNNESNIPNNESNIPNIVNVFSCHSGTAHNDLHKVKGNIILCTYAPADYSTIHSINSLLFDKKNKSDNLNDFILKNLPLLTAIGFGISYKLNDTIYSLIFDNNPVKMMDMISFPKFLQKQQLKIEKFYINLQQKFANEYPMLFPEYNFSKEIFYSHEELKKAFSMLLNINSDKLSIEEIEHLLEIDSSDILAVLYHSFPSNRQNVIEKVISYIKKVEIPYLIRAIDFDNLVALDMLLNKVDKIDSNILIRAVERGKIEACKIIINRMDEEKVSLHVLEKAIIDNNLSMFELLINKVKLRILFDETYFLPDGARNLINETFDLIVDNGCSQMVKMLIEATLSTNFLECINYDNLYFFNEILVIFSDKINTIHIAAIILLNNYDKSKLLTDKIGENKILDIAVKLDNSLAVQYILMNKNLSDDELNKIFELAVKAGSENVIEDIMNNIAEITEKHLRFVINHYVPKGNMVLAKVCNRVEKVEGSLIEEIINSQKIYAPYIISNIVDKLSDKEKDLFLHNNLYKILNQDITHINICFANIISLKIEKTQDEFKYKLLDLAIKNDAFIWIFEHIFNKSTSIDAEHLEIYTPQLEKIANMKIAYQNSIAQENIADNHVAEDYIPIIGEEYFTFDD